MGEPRFLLIRLGSFGDIIHALPAASALRESFPSARIDWIVDRRWSRLLEGNLNLNEAIQAERAGLGGIASTIRKLRAAKYSCAIDFQGLYKSALLAISCGAPRRIGFQSSYAREGPAAWFYTDRINPRGAHKVEHNLTLVEQVGARKTAARFPLAVRAEDEAVVARELAAHGLSEYFVLNPGGGWRSKCWPPGRFGELHHVLAQRYGWRGVVTFGPGEEELAQAVLEAAGNPQPVRLAVELGPLMALARGAKFLVSADTGPLHAASALGAPVIGLYGPTDPSRNGPYSPDDVVVRNPHASETTYDREASYSNSMLSITVDQVVDAVERRLRLRV